MTNMKLKRFDKNRNVKLIGVISIVLILGIIIGIVLHNSFAVFKTTKTFNIIEGKIPNKKKGDINLAVVIDNETAKKIPEKDTGYKYVDSECTNGASVRWNDDWTPTILNLKEAGTACTLKFASIYNSITVDGEVKKEFPERGDYYINMNCSNVTSASFNETTWKPLVTGIKANSSCSPVFKTKATVIKITLDGNAINSYPSKAQYGSPTVTCTGGGTGSWDETNWKPIVNNVTSNTICTIAFNSCPVAVGEYVSISPGGTSITAKVMTACSKSNPKFVFESTSPVSARFTWCGYSPYVYLTPNPHNGFTNTYYTFSVVDRCSSTTDTSVVKSFDINSRVACDGSVANRPSSLSGCNNQTRNAFLQFSMAGDLEVLSGSGTSASPKVIKEK